MGQRTEEITYNVHDRGRQHLGKDRHLDLEVLAKVVNSPGTQERVKNGDMLGYYGHWPRQVFGMAMCEGGIVGGKRVSLEPAVRTLLLHCDKDGNITHREEFLGGPDGQIAYRLYADKVGGWSTAIDAVPGTDPAIPTIFHGVDYVQEPNYNTNRGHGGVLLDSLTARAGAEMAGMLDAVLHESRASQTQLLAMFDALSQQHLALAEVCERQSVEIGQLVDIAAAGKPAAREHILDSLHAAFEPGLRMRGMSHDDLINMGRGQLVQLADLPDAQTANPNDFDLAAFQLGIK